MSAPPGVRGHSLTPQVLKKILRKSELRALKTSGELLAYAPAPKPAPRLRNSSRGDAEKPDARPQAEEPKESPKIASAWFPGLAVDGPAMNLLAPVVPGHPPVIFFDYDPRCNAAPRDRDRLMDNDSLGCQMSFCLHTTRDVHEYNAVVNTFQLAGFDRVPVGSTKFAIYWGPHPTPEMLRSFNPFQRANHFPGSWQLGRKDLLGKNIYRMRRQFPKDYNILPAGFSLPDEGAAWSQAREKNVEALWIWKPINLSCGKGIRLFGSHIPPATERKILQRTGVVQRYVDRPLLINGYKFDLRLYVVVTSFDPLKVYLYQEGLVRLATQKYHCSAESLDERTMHLTNYSVNKHAAGYKQNLDAPSKAEEAEATEVGDDEEAPASKWSLRQLQEYLASQGVDYELLVSRVEDVIIKTLIAAEPQIVNTWHQGANYSTASPTTIQQVTANQTCFEIYGFDVMVDEALQPWLLEVNIFPSFSSSSPYDKRVKTQLVADAFTLIGVVPYDHDAVEKACKEEQARRLQGARRLVSRSHTAATMRSAPLKDFGEAEWRLILETYEENLRRGHFTRIYPREGTSIYNQFFSTPRYSNLVLDRWIQLGGERTEDAPERAQRAHERRGKSWAERP